ncbi:MAG: TonB-dependent receptor [Labilithrix sp.]|nr:TonB-dependent receptor [Labilithrix sp.]MCW5817429.1 TonB-dependent receptor [Labilithrix sp.]
MIRCAVSLGLCLAVLARAGLARADVTVNGVRRAEPSAASHMDIEVGALADVPRRNAEQLLTLAPGVFLSNPSGEGHASTIFLRGFDAGEAQDIELKLEGIPINEPSNAHAHGYGDTHFIIPELVERLQVIEGPFDPRQGDFAVAGSMDYRLGLASRGVRAKAGYGSFHTRRLLALWGPAGTSRGTFAGVDFVEGDGFGPNRAHSATRFMGRYELALGHGYEAALLATSYVARFDAAGVIRQDDYEARRLSACAPAEEAQFFCLHDRNQGGGVGRHGAVLHVAKRSAESSFEQSLHVSLRDLRIRQNFTGFTVDVTPANDPQRGDGLEQSYHATTIGARGSYRRRHAALGRQHEVELGYFARHDVADSEARRLRFADGVPYRVDSDNALRITNLGAYAAGRFTPLERLVLRGGVRLETFAFGVTDENRPATDRSGARLTSENVEAFGLAVQPKLSADLALTRHVRLVTSFGIGTRSSDAQALSQGEFAPFARVRALESGVVAKAYEHGGFSLDARAIAYHTRVERDLLFDEVAGRNTSIGASNRFGALGAARLRSPLGLDLQSSLTYAEAYLPPAGASTFDLTAGVRLPYIPRWVGRVDASLHRSFVIAGRRFHGGVAAGLSYVGPRPLPFGQLGPAYGTVDAGLKLRHGMFEAGLDVTNLLDRRNKIAIYNYASSFRGPDAFPSRVTQQHFAAGPPRVAMATLTVWFDAEKGQEP